jgi:hypothetical protein
LYLLGKRGATGLLLAALAIVPLLGYEEAVPTQERVRGHPRSHLGQQLAAEHLGFDGPAAALVVGEENAAFAELFLEDPVFGAAVTAVRGIDLDIVIGKKA